ncbi:MAG: asparagine synthase (glutamine-hydrolyzing) [Chitinophagaceae bacterium]|nr:asparagine synthase (glutamine-hydrolyzing) [Chitinophagaceae bacterium]
MCGIAGIIAKDPQSINADRLKRMTDVISHRGPDGEGHWISPSGEVGLGHRRLSIIDLSHEADQPMHYMDRYTLVFNGEIYNYIELRETLLQQGYGFHTQSDTEVLMALYHRDREKCLGLLDGMFAFVLYDRQENTIFCARDRFGEKPFFYSYEKGKQFLFGSEMKCLWAGGIPKAVNQRMMFNYLAYGFVHNKADLSETFYEGCTRLPHSHYLTINLHTLELSLNRYYDIDWQQHHQSISVKDAQNSFRELFYTSVKRRLRSDVSVGSSLSGGLDSSLVVCVIDELKKGTKQKQNTFSAVFPGFKKDERQFMDMVIAKTNVDPHFVTPQDAAFLEDIDKVFHHQEEPFGSASIYAQYCVMRLAKENDVTVLLDGQGADEIMAGYHPYYIQFFNELKKHNPALYKKEMAAYNELQRGNAINRSIHSGYKNKVKRYLAPSASSLRKKYQYFQQLTGREFNSDFFHTYYPESFTNHYHYESLNHSLYASTMDGDLQDLLRFADRNSMAHSREVRLPFLSHELVDFLFTLPAEYKIREGWTKWIMRSATENIIPQEITWRKDKIGYEPPQKNWMGHSDVIENIMTSRMKLIEAGVLNPKLAKRIIQGEDASVKKDNSWAYWMAGKMI